MVHGIPLRSTLLREGQIVSIDCTVELDGYQADMARTFAVGKIDPSAQLFVDRTREAFYQGIRFAKVGYRIGDISSAIQSYVESFGYGVVRVLCGHGIGQEMHEDPEVPNFGLAGHGLRLRPRPGDRRGTHDHDVRQLRRVSKARPLDLRDAGP